MKSDVTVRVSSEGKLEIPTELESQLNPGDQYSAIVTADSIVFQKVKAGFDWEELRRRRESLPPDTNPMTMEEICEIVREVRREKRLETESQQLKLY